MSTQSPQHVASEISPDTKLAVVAARFNAKIVDALLEGCLRRLRELGMDESQIATHRVPGAFELPLAARALARTGRYAAVIALGAVVRGETPHFEYVSGECARGLADVARSEMTPVIFGVLTTNTEQQAWDRCGGKHGHAGISAAESALEMVVLMRIVGPGGGAKI